MCRKLIYLISLVLVTGLVGNTSAGLVGHWKLDEGSGTITYDSSGNENNGTLNGPIWRPSDGQIGGALEFDGIDDYVEVPDNKSFDITNEITVTAWINPVDVAEWRTIISKYAHTPAWRKDLYWLLHSGNIGVSLAGPSGIGGDDWIPNVPIESGIWAHVALSYDGAAMKMYKNGINVATNSISGDLLLGDSASNESFYIGQNTEWGEFFDGLLDDVRIYDRTLTPDQVKDLFNGIPPTFTKAFNPNPPDGGLHEDTWLNLGWGAGDFAVSHDVYIGDNFDAVSEGTEGTFRGNQTTIFFVVGFPGFPYPDGLVPGTTYYWRIDEVNDTEPNSPWKGPVWSFSIPPKTAYFPDPADGAESVDVDVRLGWTAGFGTKLHYVYFGDNFNEVNNAAGGLPQGMTTYNPGPLEMAKTYYWRVDEFDVIETHMGNIWSFTTQGAVGSQNPANGAVDVTQTPVLTWVPGIFGASHEVYFGTDKDAVKNADASSPEYKGSGNLGSESYDPRLLEWDTTYYWRIDEANNANADSPWTGPLWSFTTANFLVVDDFESYNDLNEDEPGSNRIYLAWIDGFDNPTVNGSVVGHANPPFAEQTTVHSGNQSMPIAYDNSVGKSEATSVLTANRDWTVNGVNKLTIWYRGGSANTAEPMYVIVNGTAAVTNDNPDAAQAATWTQWNIDLQAFADQGMNLANVNSITLGLGNRANPTAGGSGMMYFDDIRLYPPAP
ncbi:MAG: LamG domain-containing protein [Planctomycetes bacterium]|nr:LamG domain-containing protein [Planctomycetota bacterium]